MSQQYIGQLMAAGFSFAPRQWAACNGQLVSIQSNQALFALLGTFFGGNGTTTFALPDLRSRIPISTGTNYLVGQQAGTEGVSLNIGAVPGHTHNVMASSSSPSLNAPANDALASNLGMYMSGQAPATGLSPAAVSNYGGSQPHENRQPYLVINWCIAISGIFPSRS